MKPLLMLTLLVTAAIPLGADEPKPAHAQTGAQEEARAKEEAPAKEDESPMVRAARRANRLGRKPGTVITNDSIKKSKGHVTTTTVQRPIYVPKPEMPSDEAAAIRKRESEREQARVQVIGEEKRKQEELETRARRAKAAEMAEEGYYENPDDDPARAERDADEASRDDAGSNTTADPKPPQH